MFTAIAAIVFIVCSLILLLPRSEGCARGCLTELARLAALAVGSLSALIVLGNSGESVRDLFGWQGVSSLLRYAAVLVTLVAGACALGLAAHGWQTLAGRGNAVEDQADLSVFDPTQYLNTNTYTQSADDSIGGCLFTILIAVVGGLFWIGLQLAAGIANALLPSAKTSRAARGLLSLVYGAVVFGLLVVGLAAVFGAGGGETQTPNDAGPVGRAAIEAGKM